MLLKNSLVMYDRETETFWSHYTGEGLEGPLKDETLKVEASFPTVKWSEWVAQYPDTLVLSVNGETYRKQSSYAAYVNDDSKAGLIPLENEDNRLSAKSLVLGIKEAGVSYAFALGELKKKIILRTKIGEDDAVLFSNEKGSFYGAFKTPKDVKIVRLENRTLVAEDGSRFSVFDGVGENHNLEIIPVIRSFWFAWNDHHPKTEFWP